MTEEYFSRKKLAKYASQDFDMVSRAQGVPADKAKKQAEDIANRVTNDEELELIENALNLLISRYQPLIDKRLEEIVNEVTQGIPVRFPRN